MPIMHSYVQEAYIFWMYLFQFMSYSVSIFCLKSKVENNFKTVINYATYWYFRLLNQYLINITTSCVFNGFIYIADVSLEARE